MRKSVVKGLKTWMMIVVRAVLSTILKPMTKSNLTSPLLSRIFNTHPAYYSGLFLMPM